MQYNTCIFYSSMASCLLAMISLVAFDMQEGKMKVAENELPKTNATPDLQVCFDFIYERINIVHWSL